MPNHIHLIAVPVDLNGLSAALKQTHTRYSLMINKREGWSGHLWQGRFSSYVMDESYALCAARYIELNPVVAGIVERAEDYEWSSAAAHIGLHTDMLLKKNHALRDLVSDWGAFLKIPETPQIIKELQKRY